MDKFELIEKIEEAQEHLQECISLLEEVINETSDDYMRAYLLEPLQIRLTSDHGFLTNDPSLETLKEKILHPEEEE